MSEFKTTPMLNSWELRIKLLEEVIDIKDAEIAALRARCEAAEWKAEKAREAMKSSSSTYSVFDKLRQILE